MTSSKLGLLLAFGLAAAVGAFPGRAAVFNVDTTVLGVVKATQSGWQKTDAVAGAWQDPPPGPSGDGILAYVEFITTENGTGESPITVTGVSTTSSVPEPGTLALFAGGLVLLARRRLADRRTAQLIRRAAMG